MATIEDITAREDDGTVQVRVSLSAPATAANSVKVHTRSGSAVSGQDYFGFTRTISFAIGDTEKTVNLTLVNDTQGEPTETMALRLFDASGLTIGKSLGTVTVLDDDNAPQSAQVSVADAQVNESDGNVSVRVSLSNPLPTNTSVVVHTRAQTAMGGQDFFGFTRTVKFPAGQTERFVTLTVRNDTTPEPNETLLIRVSSVNGAGLSIGRQQGVVTIID